MTLLLILTALAAWLACAMSLITLVKRPQAAVAAPDLIARLAGLEQVVGLLTASGREDAKLAREEVSGAIARQAQSLETRLSSFAQTQGEHFTAMRQEASDGRAKLEEAVKTSSEAFALTQTTRLGETNLAMKDLAETLQKAAVATRDQQKQALDAVAATIKSLTEANDKKQDAMRETVTKSLDQLRKENEGKLEQMRATVEEKLQGTLEARLGESFKLVSDRLEMVHKGLGEMQTLATGVGDLKRVLTNVKSRGGWGEVQLGMLLEDMLTPDQYAHNVSIKPGSREAVEYAIRLPGKVDEKPVYLPIDAKFPHEDYDRLLQAQETGLVADVEKAGLALERAVKAQAKIIAEKYVHPPHSTDFAIMYLPTEGLYAEVIRRPGLVSELQSRHRVTIAGPTTLTVILNALQMGFRTLAIEKRSSEVWQVLSAAKGEFRKYGELWDRLGKQLATAQNTVAEAGKRTKAVERTLKSVEEAEPALEMRPILALPSAGAAENADSEAA